MENSSWIRALACYILLVMIMLISPSTIHAGKLGDFEQETKTRPPKTKYTANTGIPELRQKIAEKLQKDNQLTYTPNQIVVSSGAKQSILNALFAIVSSGQEVV